MVGQTREFSRPFLVIFRHLQALLKQLLFLFMLELPQIGEVKGKPRTRAGRKLAAGYAERIENNVIQLGLTAAVAIDRTLHDVFNSRIFPGQW